MMAFRKTFAELESRISILVNLPLESLDGLALQSRLDEIGGPGGKTRLGNRGSTSEERLDAR